MTIKGPPLDAGIAELTGETLVELLDCAASRTPDRGPSPRPAWGHVLIEPSA